MVKRAPIVDCMHHLFLWSVTAILLRFVEQHFGHTNETCCNDGNAATSCKFKKCQSRELGFDDIKAKILFPSYSSC